MAPIKFEDDLKDRLEKRTITPSDHAWDKLSTRLELQSEKDGKKGVWRVAIAASIIGLLLVSYPFFKNDMTTTKSPTVVDTNKGNTIKLKEKNEVPSIIQTERAKQELVNNASEEKRTQPLNKSKNVRKNPVHLADLQNKQVQAPSSKKEMVVNADNFLVAQKKKAEAPILVLNSEQETIRNNGSTIDSLLSMARRDIAMGELNKNTTVPIDHNRLLQDVEDDLDESLRDKLLKTVRDGYSSIREELADRND